MRSLCAAALLSGALFACGGGGEPANLVGSWSASKAVFRTLDGAVKIDVVALGANITLELKADHTWQLIERESGEPDEITSGTWVSSSDVLTLRTSVTSTMEFDFQLSGNTLSLVGADVSFDIDRDGQAEGAKFDLTLVRK